MLSQALGFMPSFDYALSEVIVDPVRGAKMLARAQELYGSTSCPRQYSPQGNRYRDAVDANKGGKPGGTLDDWGL
jgi:hypothetical protein